MHDHPNRAEALLRMVSLRYRAHNVPPFVVGAVAAGDGRSSYLVFGTAGVIVWAITQELMNKHADRVEDAIDYPERGPMYEQIGNRTWVRLIELAMVTYAALVIAMAVVSNASWHVLVPWVLVMLCAVAYSYGPRLKAHTYGGPMLTAAIQASFFQMGWRYSGDATAEFLATLSLLFLGMVSLMYAKDAPSLAGDGAIGYRSLYLRLKGDAGSRRALILLMVPYLQATALVVLGVVGAGYLGVWAALPVTLAFARAMRHAETQPEYEVVREIGAYTKLAYVGVVLYIFEPEPVTVVVMLAAVAWYSAATRWFHPERGLHRREQVERARALIMGRPDRHELAG